MTDSFVAVNVVQLASANFSHALTAEAKKIFRISATCRATRRSRLARLRQSGSFAFRQGYGGQVGFRIQQPF
jgi:hypothetical protein